MALAAVTFHRDTTAAADVISLPDLERALVDALERFEALSRQRTQVRDPVTRARLGRDLEDALSEIGTLRGKIAKLPAASLADVAVKLRRLAAATDNREAEVLAITALEGLDSLA